MATRLSGRVRRLEQTRGTCTVCRGKDKAVVGYMQPELAIRTAIDDRPANSVADLDEVPGCPGCGKKVRVVIEYVEAPLPAGRPTSTATSIPARDSATMRGRF